MNKFSEYDRGANDMLKNLIDEFSKPCFEHFSRSTIIDVMKGCLEAEINFEKENKK